MKIKCGMNAPGFPVTGSSGWGQLCFVTCNSLSEVLLMLSKKKKVPNLLKFISHIKRVIACAMPVYWTSITIEHSDYRTSITSAIRILCLYKYKQLNIEKAIRSVMKFTIQQWLPLDSPSGGTLTYCDGTQYPKQPAIPINQQNKKV